MPTTLTVIIFEHTYSAWCFIDRLICEE